MVKVEKPIVEKVNTVAKVEEVPVVKVDKVEKVNTVAKVEEVPVVKVDKVEKVNTVAKVEEVPVVKVDKVNTVAENTDTPTEKSTTTKTGDVITKVSSFDDIDGVTITYRVVTASGGVDVVPIFLEKSIATTNETDAPKTTEKFIEHIELKNPNENKTEKIEDPTMVKVATNNANRAPVELSKVVKVDKVDKVEVVEKPLKTEKINQGEIIDYAEKIKKVEPVVEKKEEPIKVSTPAVKVEKTPVVKVAEKIEEPVKVTTPVVPEKPVDFGNNNPLKITDAERSSKSSRNITSINSDCADRKATEEDFFKTRKKIIDADSNEDAMVDAALKQFKLKCFSVEQIKNLAIVFLTDEGKYKLVDAAYPYTHESHLYASLEPLFKEAYFLKRFKVMLDR